MEFGRFQVCSLSFYLCACIIIMKECKGMVDAQNLALNMPTNQSSTFYLMGKASNAVDGDMDPIYIHGSCTHTQDVGPEWWEVDLGLTYNVTQIYIFNRDEAYCTACNRRLKNFIIKGGIDCGTTVCYTDCYTQIDSVGPSKTFDLQNCTARYIQVYKTDHDALTLCEVEVFGEIPLTNDAEALMCSACLPKSIIVNNSSTTTCTSSDAIAVDSMTTNTISTNSMTTDSISSDYISTDSNYISSDYVSTDISIDSISTDYISSDSISTDYISSDSISTDYISTSSGHQTDSISNPVIETPSITQNIYTNISDAPSSTGIYSPQTTAATETVEASTHTSNYADGITTSIVTSIPVNSIPQSYSPSVRSKSADLGATPTVESVDVKLPSSVTFNSYTSDMATSVVTSVQSLTVSPSSVSVVTTYSPTPAYESVDSIPTTLMADITTTIANAESSACSCGCHLFIYDEKEWLHEKLEELNKNLTLNTAELSRYRRKKTSAADERPSAMYMGCTGVFLLFAIFILILLVDFTRAMHYNLFSMKRV